MVYKHFLYVIFCVLPIFSCSVDKKIVFEPVSKESQELTVTTLPFGKFSDQGKIVGKLPQEMKVEELKGKMIRISAPGYSDQYWVLPEGLGETSKVQIALKPSFADMKDPQLLSHLSKLGLVLLKSYQSLSQEKFDSAIELADKVIKDKSMGAAPYVVKGLALYQKGDKQNALAIMDLAISLHGNTEELIELKKALEK